MLKVHALRPDGKPFCGTWVEQWNKQRMYFEHRQGYADEVTCNHPACRAA